MGSEPLTPELAERHGYILSSHGQRLQLDVPLFTTGYKYTVRTAPPPARVRPAKMADGGSFCRTCL